MSHYGRIFSVDQGGKDFVSGAFGSQISPARVTAEL